MTRLIRLRNTGFFCPRPQPLHLAMRYRHQCTITDVLARHRMPQLARLLSHAATCSCRPREFARKIWISIFLNNGTFGASCSICDHALNATITSHVSDNQPKSEWAVA
ncbi:d3.1 [Ichnoviriform fugitivi]|uniref:D3.1 n=1 Tax=Ichnoviriform fugitivi TaxID=265522 RepID=A2Q0K2_9VIRU|nr:d3.1 [Ichnoviriform fugitivi]BAF45717.1 d3.1 [Ichnoviriform fugitivi]